MSWFRRAGSRTLPPELLGAALARVPVMGDRYNEQMQKWVNR